MKRASTRARPLLPSIRCARTFEQVLIGQVEQGRMVLQLAHRQRRLGRSTADNRAQACWDAFPRSVKRGILEWISNAKKPETRAKRVEETARLASENKRANQWRQ
jgi:hypothetical protein